MRLSRNVRVPVSIPATHRPRAAAALISAVLALALAVWSASVCPAFSETLEEKVREFDLKNGMKFLVVERHEAPVVFCAVAFNVGSSNERTNITGISHLLEHMMFKGTEMMGTKNYKAELPYIRKTDELGERTIALRKEMGEWRFERFHGFSLQVIESFSKEEKERIGADKYEQNRLMAEKIRSMPSLPDSVADVPYLVEDRGVNYLEKYLEYELAWGEMARLLDEQREYMIKEELWGLYMNNGSRFLNAFTSNDATVYLCYLPSNRLELFMLLESDRMESPVFREFWSERDVVMEERRLSENDPDDMLDEAFNAVAFSASPYRWPVLGWMSDIRTIDRKELEDYHRIYYAPNNAVCMVVGDVRLEEVQKLARRYFEAIPPQPAPPAVETSEPEQQGERRIVLEHAANPRLMMGFHRPSHRHPDAVTIGVLESILAGGRTSRLYKTIYEEKQLTASPPQMYSGPGDRYDNLMVIVAEPRHPHTLEEVEGAILEELGKLKTAPVTERELQRVKNQIDANMVRSLGSNIGIAFQVGFSQLFYGDYRLMFTNIERTKKVTAEDLQRVAKQYFTAKNRTVAHRVQIEQEDNPGGEERIDMQALMQFVQTLPQEEKMAIFQKFQSLKTDQEREAFGMELYQRMKAAQGKK
ncbi:MAG: insulinase family protein [Candidatus Eisenbacteria bacterium]|nr:insulinase family protein [Candidatus Eisenbacteria bacterium]